jgi:pimeloyl-ACP methyl ester carboxylesterase
MTPPSFLTLALMLLVSGAQPAAAQLDRHSYDPVSMDPPSRDTLYPAETQELAFESMGNRLNAFMYVASGKQPHPTVILLHGFPGNERNLDLAQALRRSGMNVLYFSYRGAWGSGGVFSFAHTLEDVASAIRYVRSDSIVQASRVDPRRIMLVGHSMGGWLALMGAAADSTVTCAAALDFWNVGADGRAMQTDRTADSSFTAYANWVSQAGAPLHADSGRVLTREIVEHAALWDLDNHAAELRTRPLFIISSTKNEYHASFLAALRAAHASKVNALQWRTDHGFSALRIHLAHALVRWIKTQCR